MLYGYVGAEKLAFSSHPACSYLQEQTHDMRREGPVLDPLGRLCLGILVIPGNSFVDWSMRVDKLSEATGEGVFREVAEERAPGGSGGLLRPNYGCGVVVCPGIKFFEG